MARSLTLREELIRGIIMTHRGPANAISSKDIAANLPGGDSEGRPVTRREIRELIAVAKVPIGANHRGYFLIETEEQLYKYQDRLLQRIDGIVERGTDVTEAFYR